MKIEIELPDDKIEQLIREIATDLFGIEVAQIDLAKQTVAELLKEKVADEDFQFDLVKEAIEMIKW